jgi:hypothetical protein
MLSSKRKQRFLNSALGVGVAVFALTGAATMAQASLFLSGSFNLSVYTDTAAIAGGGGGAAAQANPANPIINPANLLGSGIYTGDLNFAVPSGGTNTVGGFLTSAPGGTFVSSGYNLGLSTGGTSLFNSTNILSQGAFVGDTVMVFTGNLGAGTAAGNVTHDDGATLRDGFNGTSYATFVGGQSFPTAVSVQAYAGLTGAFEIIYVEANGLPADLIVSNLNNSSSSVPLPAALPLFASGLGAMGLFGGWRRKRKNAAALAA